MKGGGERDQARCAKRGVQGSNQAGGGGAHFHAALRSLISSSVSVSVVHILTMT